MQRKLIRKNLLILIIIVCCFTLVNCSKKQQNDIKSDSCDATENKDNLSNDKLNPDNTKTDEPNPDNTKTDEPNPDNTKTDEPNPDNTKIDEPDPNVNGYAPSMYDEIEKNIEYEIIDISEEEYKIRGSESELVYILYVRINHCFDLDLVSKTNYDVFLDENLIEDIEYKNREYEELCTDEYFLECKELNEELYQEMLRDTLFKIAVKKEDLNYFTINDTFIGHIDYYKFAYLTDEKDAFQVIDMTNIGYSLKIKDNHFNLDGLSQEQCEKMKGYYSFFNVNRFLPKQYEFTLELPIDSYVDWLVAAYTYSMERKYSSCIR